MTHHNREIFRLVALPQVNGVSAVFPVGCIFTPLQAQAFKSSIAYFLN
jgi:hypothetical protein